MWPKHRLSGAMQLLVPGQETLNADTEGSSQGPGRESRKKWGMGKCPSLQSSMVHRAAAGLGLGKGFPLLSLSKIRH